MSEDSAGVCQNLKCATRICLGLLWPFQPAPTASANSFCDGRVIATETHTRASWRTKFLPTFVFVVLCLVLNIDGALRGAAAVRVLYDHAFRILGAQRDIFGFSRCDCGGGA